MSHSRSTRTPAVLAATIAASFCAVAQAGPVETIYSAENALYGAGYEIGKADGWMDNTLRSAIRQYQSGNDELQATGNLDPQTLSALGISPEDNSTISDNAVLDRQAAMAALGMSEERFGSGSASRRIAAAPKPEPKPEPEPEPERVVQPDPEPEVQPEPEIAVQEKPEPEPVASAPAEPEVVPPREPTAEPELASQTTEPVAESIPEPELTVAEPETKAAPEAETMVEVSAVEESSEADVQLPDEPTAAGNPEISEAPDESEPLVQSSGGFFSSVFDFLFGWLI
ncbi:peptidoglycan-binding protein [Marinobacter sp. TBZ242]|uniref:Peptidoglycan-binding protein n=1 Tax=Marinobacter azerbaijanicus TaxID=3050455 RepID=A0ABT7IK75_9GAMM|nr:peptidoglycan-binding protein [Marinobacter sp. TBZ242]MDL0433484.1 peptidoglycan-binding protein [Marinobacter sp. TBZ242]